MKVIKNINNNVSLCLDNAGNEVVVFGKGIGFTKPPLDIPLENIQRTFYDVNKNYLSVIAQLDENILNVSAQIVDYANEKFDHKFSNNAIFTLADHIQFAIKRKNEGINIKLPLLYDIKLLYPKELEIGLYALRVISKKLNVQLNADEATSITMHMVNYGNTESDNTSKIHQQTISMATKIIEDKMHIDIDKSTFFYTRFSTHMYYLLNRLNKHTEGNVNDMLLETLKKEYFEIYECALAVAKGIGLELNDDELVYLIIHINKLCQKNGLFPN